MEELLFHEVDNYITDGGAHYDVLSISYQLFGRPLGSAPIVIVNHALTGNSDIISPIKGWWREVVGDNKVIDTLRYTVVAFNIPGNGYDGNLIHQYRDFTAKDIALLFHLVLTDLKVTKVHAVIGGSLGGGIAWEMACLFPDFSSYIIPIASDWKATDWVIGHNAIQESILMHSSKPIEDARKMAMLFYRTPESFGTKFNRTRTNDHSAYNVETWLDHHGEKLKNRFQKQSYLMMNHLLTTINVVPENKTVQEVLELVKSTIIQVGINSDLFFVSAENEKTKVILDELNIPNEYHEVKSRDGHDAFLIEHEQISEFLLPIFEG